MFEGGEQTDLDFLHIGPCHAMGYTRYSALQQEVWGLHDHGQGRLQGDVDE
jgi:hypothetical protein